MNDSPYSHDMQPGTGGFGDAETVTIVVSLLGVYVAAIAAVMANRVARRQMEFARRPVLVPLHGNYRVTFRGGEIHAGAPHQSENPPDRDDLPRYSAVFLAVQNIGAGAALNVRGEVRAPRGRGVTDYHTGGIGVDQQEVVQFVSSTSSLAFTGDDSGVVFTVDYEDVAGKPYATRIRFDIGSNAYEVVHFERGQLPPAEPNTAPGPSRWV